jgi:hypothetical protein
VIVISLTGSAATSYRDASFVAIAARRAIEPGIGAY